MTEKDKESIDKLKKYINNSKGDVDLKKGVNNLLFTVLMAERGVIPHYLPEDFEDYLDSEHGKALRAYYFNLRIFINEFFDQ